jgi:hypothetical protein
MIILVVFFWLLLSGVVGGEARKRRNRDPAYWMAIAAFISPPIAFLILMMLPRLSDVTDIRITR